VSDVIRLDSIPLLHPGALPVVPLPMSSFDRRRVRRRLEAPDGTVFELALPTGSVLHVAQAIHLTAHAAYVIVAADEDVLVIAPRSLAEAARVGHLVGNLHRDLDVDDDGTLTALWDEPLERRLRTAGLDAWRDRRPFRGRAPGEHAH
jgi:urease accessory protein